MQEQLSQRYFFETDLLARLYLLGAVVEELPHRARYGNESSSLRPLAVLLPFLFCHLRTTLRRLLHILLAKLLSSVTGVAARLLLDGHRSGVR